MNAGVFFLVIIEKVVLMMMLKMIVFLISIISFSVLLYIVGNIWFRGKRSTYLKLFFVMGLVHSFWVLFNGINLLLEEELYKQVYPFVMIGACILPHAMIRYTLYFTESRFARSRLISWIFTALPALDILLLLTNPLHHEFISGYDGIRPLGGRLFAIHALISYIPLLISIIILFRYIFRNIRKTPQLFYIGLGIFIPVILNVLYTFNIFDLGFDITPYSFLAMFALFTIYSINLRLFNIKETAITSLFSSLSDAFLVVDNSGMVTEANPAFTRAFPDFSLQNDKTTAKDVAEYLESITIEKSYDDIFTAFSSSINDIVHEEITVSVQGEQRNYSLSKDVITERDQYAGFIITLSDISSYRQMINEINAKNTKLTELKDIAELASNAKSEFLSRMSHEIRTPLNAVIGMAQVALKSSDNEKKNLSIKEVLTASAHLLDLLNDVLDMAKIESGKFEIVNEPFRILSVTEEVKNIISPRCNEKNICFNIECNGISDSYLLGDKLRLKQVFLNLLGNAVKFTEEDGKIEFGITVINEDERWIAFDFTVADSGIGMTEEQITHLFVPFEQADKKIATKFGGTGLGLAISKNLMEKMGGRITVQSQPGKGSIFSVSISFEKTNELQIEAEVLTLPDLSGKHMLLVEDVEINRLIVQELLFDTHINIDEAEDGRQAVEKISASPENYYDIVFMDVQMPNMNGYEATRHIRALNRQDATTIPIIALTANAYREDMAAALESGMNGHLSKPIDFDAIISVLVGQLS